MATVAFPSISTGIYGYPFADAANIAIAATRAFMEAPTRLSDVIFCCFSESDARVYDRLLKDQG